MVADAVVGGGVDGDGVGDGPRRRSGRTDRGRAAGRAFSDAARQCAKLHRLQEGGQHRGLRLAHRQGVDVGGHGGVVGEADQFAGQAHLVGEAHQGLALLRLLDLVGALQEGVEVAELGEELHRRLDADAGRARDVVDAVAGQGLDLHHPLGAETEFLDHLLAPDLQLLHRVEHADLLVDQLHQVLVGGDDDHLAAGLGHLSGVGGDQVVGLVAVELQRRHAERPCGLAHQGKLRDQILRRRRAVSLVLVVELVAEGLLGAVEDHRQMGGLLQLHLAEELPQHVAEARDGPQRHAVALARQGRQGMEGAEDVARSVDQIEADGLVHVDGPHARVARVDSLRVEGQDLGHGGRIRR